ncbi:MAG: glycerol-3-phosphate 1-O-acyltransferase PlsY [Alphaproteobacteria bacterium]|nr:glycerol-3-phosphate 1-O-acyltransferase PlsY [Alphaproteobacteria bacterium]
MPVDTLQPISWELSLPYYAAAMVFGYLMGSIPFGLLFTRWAGLGDVRAIGSGNIGATNVLRTGNRWIAAATLLCDGGKGAFAVLVADGTIPHLLTGTYPWGGSALAVLAAIASFAGHVFPVWLGFKGGKGVATFLGTLLALSPHVGLAACATWLVTAGLTRMSSLSALVAAALSPVFLWLGDEYLIAGAALLLTALIFYTHRANIQRILAGTEPRIGEAAKSA